LIPLERRAVEWPFLSAISLAFGFVTMPLYDRIGSGYARHELDIGYRLLVVRY